MKSIPKSLTFTVEITDSSVLFLDHISSLSRHLTGHSIFCLHPLLSNQLLPSNVSLPEILQTWQTRSILFLCFWNCLYVFTLSKYPIGCLVLIDMVHVIIFPKIQLHIVLLLLIVLLIVIKTMESRCFIQILMSTEPGRLVCLLHRRNTCKELKITTHYDIKFTSSWT